MFGPGKPLDAREYYIIMPDGIGRGGSSKPSDGLHANFPHYGYIDLAALVFAVNFADDLLNPVSLGAMARVMPRVRNDRYEIVPEGPDTIGHQSLTQAKLWAPYLADLMNSTR